MNLSADHHFSIGEQHIRQGKPCQDYALSGTFEEICFAIVSDGCSNGEHTDVGARFTALSTSLAIRNYWSTSKKIFNENTPQEINIQQNIIQRGTYHMLGLTHKDMLATCLYACVSTNGGFAHALGDGIIAWKFANGSMAMRRLDWDQNAPLYPVYGEDNFRSFIAYHGGNTEAKAFLVEEWLYSTSKGHEKIKTSEFTVAEGIKGYTELFSEERIRKDKIEFVAILSDGATQVENMDWKDAVVELLSFKNTCGAFAKRRAIGFLKSGKKPIDDLACAVIRIENPSESEGFENDNGANKCS